jgi:Mn2+/Fe2+ NRAMP family transporter
MNGFAAPRWLTITSTLVAAFIIALNIKLIADFFAGTG